MKRTIISVCVYAFLVLMGGVIGYLKAQSLASLVMGTIFAIGLSLSSLAIAKGKVWGLPLARALTFCLGTFFFYRFFMTFKFMPAGLMCLLSLVTLIILFSPIAKAIQHQD